MGYVGLKTVFILQIIWLIRKPISGDQFTISVISFPFFLAQRAFPFYPQEVKAFIFHFIVNTIFCFPAFSRLKNILSITSLPVHPGWVGKMKEIILSLSLSLARETPPTSCHLIHIRWDDIASIQQCSRDNSVFWSVRLCICVVRISSYFELRVRNGG